MRVQPLQGGRETESGDDGIEDDDGAGPVGGADLGCLASQGTRPSEIGCGGTRAP